MLPTTTKPRVKLTGADYMTLTPPSHRGRRYQLIEGELIEMAGPNDAHQAFIGELYYAPAFPNWPRCRHTSSGAL